MADTVAADICIIGAGSGGLSVAAVASQLGASTVLIEKGRMGGDCLNYGCVPSKALLAAAHAAAAPRHGARFGVDARAVGVDGGRVHDHVHGVIAAIQPNDSVERFEGLGVRVVPGEARFTDSGEVAVDGIRITARRFVVATGSSPFVPPIAGLAGVPFFTNETIFDLRTVPNHLLILGGGPIGIEMAQAHRALGAAVTVVEMAAILPKDDPELVAVIRRCLTEDGVDVREGVRVVGAENTDRGVALAVETNGERERIEGSHLLIAAGRRPNVADLGLENAGIAHSPSGIKVDRRLRTTNRRVFAVGDVVGGYQFTHVASYHAGIVIKNALFRIPARVDSRCTPWVTYTRPELAQVGLTENEAANRYADLRILRWPFRDNDRAQAERLTEGLIKVVTTKRGRILGAGIVGAAAGELIQTWVLAMSRNLGVGAIADMIAPYPTLGEVSKRVAGTFFAPLLFGERSRMIVRLLRAFG
jgi:pyruvate/2-oxoglutarate dehydrogenase complex dihydrolipoamide dehydrogenase (E3) component